MRMLSRVAVCALLGSLTLSLTMSAQSLAKPTPSRIVSAIDNNRVVQLPGNTAPMARAEFDKGAVEDSLPMAHMMLLLQRSATQESELETLLAQQSDPSSASYHHWLTPTEFGQRFGPSDADVAQVTGWLQSQGLTVDKVSHGRVTIQFSGTAAQVQTAFHTAIHRYVVEGETHYANVSDPQIPEALAPVVAGVTSLHNFLPRPMSVEGQRVKRDAKSGRFVAVDGESGGASAEFTRTNSSGNTKEDVTPTDFATIYNVLPLWNSGINGAGQTIAIAGESDINLSDIATFQSSFGLANNVPNVIHNGTAPGYTSSQEEQELDVEWSGAVAPGATITLVVSANTNTTGGFLLSSEYVIDNQVATILSESYGNCEQTLGTSGNATFNSLWQQGSAEGISIFGAAGDQGSAGCENSGTHTLNPVTTGLAVNGIASSPYITAVGGTDFLWQESPAGTYWSAANGTNGVTALGYIPEIPWNATCVNPYVVQLYGAASAEANCNTLAGNSATSNLVFTTGGSGGVSACTTYSGNKCSGGYTKPSWQTGVGVPADGKRDLPDVSLFAGSGIPYGAASTSYLICYSGSYPCSYSNSTDVVYQEIGGTSVSSPAMAGVMALVQQKIGSAQGLANPILYQLAAAESSLAACNSNTVGSGNSCVFYDTTTGSNSMACKSGSPNCTVATTGDSLGLLSGYNAGTGYDQATGLGSVNVANLVAAWAAVPSAPITFTIPNKTYGTAAFTVSATSASTGAFSYSIVSGPATISGSTITLTGAGTVVAKAFQAAAAGYAAGSATATFTVAQATPTLTLSIPNKTYGVAPFTVAATTNSTGTLTYSILSGPATVSGSTVTVTGAGTVQVQVSQAASTNYTAATATATFTVSAAAPTITFSIANQTYGATPFTVSASSNSTGAFTYSIVSGPATISGATITLTGTGTVKVQASEAATTNYTAGTATATFTVSAAAPTITFSIANQTYGAAPFTVGASSNSAGTFTYTIQSGPATISGSTVTLTGAGTVTVLASQAASGNYAAGSATATFTVAQATAAITFNVANQTYGAAPFTVSASSASTGAFTYSVVSGPATMSGSTVTLTGVGTVVLQVSQAATTNYTAATKNATFTVTQGTPTITFTVSNQTYGAAPFAVSASSASAGAFTYSVVSGPATISGSTVTVTGTGTVVLMASQAATTNYAAATQNASFTVSAATPTISFAISNQVYGVAPFSVSASSNSGGAFTYSIVSGPATISGSTVTVTGAGTVVVMASQAATTNYTSATQSASFTVSAATPAISFAISNQVYGASPFTVSASSNSTGAFTYSIVSGPATVSGSTVTVTGAGTVVVKASQAATTNYAAGSTNASFTVSTATPTITFSIPNQSYGAAPFSVSASSNSNGAFTYAIVSGPATISGSTITLTGSGTVTVQASQAATVNYAAGTANASFTVAQANAPTIQFAIANQSYGAAPFNVSATSNSSGAFTYSIVSGPATISGSTVTVTGSGTVTVQAAQAASGTYAAGTANASFTVAQPNAPTIQFAIANQSYGAAPFSVSASSNSTGAFTYSIVSGPATLSGSTVTVNGAGTVVVMASQAAAGSYAAGSATASFTVAQPNAPTIQFAIANQSYGAAPFNVSATSNSSGAFTYSIVSGPATISGSTVTVNGSGTVTVQAAQAASGSYTAGSVTASFTVAQAPAPTISFAIANQAYGAAPFNISATSNSSGAFTYSIVSGPATISGSTVTVSGSGTVTVKASQAATASYAAGSATASFTVAPAPAPTISFAIANQAYGAAPFNVSATSNSTGAFTYAIVSGPATLSGSTVTVNGSGTVTVQASQAASASYAAGSATASFTVAQAPSPTITFAIANQTYGAAPFNVSATSNSTGAFTYAIASGPATISGSTVTLTGTGTVTVTASQAASSNYAAATATASFTVSQAPAPTISFAIANQSAGADPFTVSASSNSTGAFTYTIVSGPATISGSTITLTGAGTVVVMASQAASATYAAGSANASFMVTSLAASITWTPSATSLFAGNALGSGILDAMGSVAGSLTYTATLGNGTATAITSSSTLLTPGNYMLTATLVPASSSYSTVSQSITLTVTGSYIWVVNPSGSVTEFHGAAAVNPAATVGGGVGATVDAAGDLWTLNTGGGSLAEFNASGTAVQNGLTGGGLTAATALAIDGNGTVWVTNGNNSVSVFANNGAAISPATGYTGGGLNAPSGLAIDTSGNVWITNAGNSSVTEILGGAAPVAPTTTAVQNKTLGVRP
jgi:hypothetical protein